MRISLRIGIPTTALALVVVIGGFCMRPLWIQEIGERDLFFPRKLPVPAGRPTRRILEIPFSDNQFVRGWHLPVDHGRCTLLYAYGNGDTAADSLDRVTWLRDALLAHLVIVDYRGYGFSDGRPSVQALLDDMLRVYDECMADPKIPGRPILMYGRSIGTVPAIHLAAHRPLDGLILETPFPDVESVISSWGRLLLPPFRWLIGLRPSSGLAQRHPQPRHLLAEYHGPLLVIHGNRDATIPIDLGRRMFDLSPSGDKVFCEVKGAGHNDLFINRPPASDALRRFARTVVPRPASDSR